MNRRTNRKSVKKKKKSSLNKQSRNNKRTKTLRKQRGGDDREFKSVLLSILNDTYIPFLPTTVSVKDLDQTNNYLYCVSAFDLLTIIGKNPKYSASKSITNIVKDVNNESRDIYNIIGDMSKIPVSRKVLSNFMINCARLKDNQYLMKLREYILECEDYLSLKYVNWYKVTLGLIKLDDEFESMIINEIRERRIFLDTDTFKYGLEILEKDKNVKNMFKQRIIDCGYKPQGFFDKLMGTISWDSYNECFKCSDNKCVVYLDDNYKAFLNKKHKIKSVDKIKILIYVELRLRSFSKYVSLEGMRIIKKKHRKAKELLNYIYKDDKNNGRLYKNDHKQFVMKQEIFGGELPVGSEQQAAVEQQQAEQQPEQTAVEQPQAEQQQPEQQVEQPQPEQAVVEQPQPEQQVEQPQPEQQAEQPQPEQQAEQPQPEQAAVEQVAVEQPQPEQVAVEQPQPEQPVVQEEQPVVQAEQPIVQAEQPVVQQEQPVVQQEQQAAQPKEESFTDTIKDSIKSIVGVDEEDPNQSTDQQGQQQQGEQQGQQQGEQQAQQQVEQQVEQQSEEQQEQQNTVLDQDVIKSTSVVYLTYNDTKPNDYASTKKDRQTIASEIRKKLITLTGVSDGNTIQVYRVRFGPMTTSIEVGIVVGANETMNETDIKQSIVNSVVDKSIRRKLFLTQLESIKDIYFDGISKFPEVLSLPSQFKRLLVEMPGDYPETENSRLNFEEKTISYIKEFLEEPDMNILRIQLERVSRVPDNDERVVVQFLLMNSFSETKSPNQIIMKFKDNYNTGNNEFSNQYQLTNVVFGEPSIILDGSENDILNTFEEEKIQAALVDEATLSDLEGKYERIAYYGCDLTLADLKNNLISANTPLPKECEGSVHQYFRGIV